MEGFAKACWHAVALGSAATPAGHQSYALNRDPALETPLLNSQMMICPGRGFSLLNDLPRTSPPQILKDHLPPTPDWRAAVCRGLFGVTQSLGRSQRNTAESSWRPLFSLPHSLQK